MIRHAALGLFVAHTVMIAGAVAELGPDNLSPEQAILARRIGRWENVNVIQPGPWVPDGARTESVETIRWIMGHAFLEGNARESGTDLTNTHLIGYDPISNTYRFWYFDSRGVFPKAPSIGRWDAEAQTLRFSSELPDGVSSLATIRFIDDDHHVWAAKWTRADGTVLLEMEGHQTRRHDARDEAKNGREVSPSRVNDPAGPPELKRLLPFIGRWNAEVRDNRAVQPMWSGGSNSQKFWTLGGRFLRDEVRDERGELRLLGLWGFDPDAQTHREWYFYSDGNVLEATAEWDEANTTFNLQGKMLQSGTLEATRRLLEDRKYVWDSIGRDSGGSIVLNLSGRQHRQD